MDRDPHGNVQVSRIETEKLLVAMVKKELIKRKVTARYKGSFSAQSHFFGYEGRAAFPSNFDSNYCYALGYCASLLVREGKTGYIAAIRHLNRDIDFWQAWGIPLSSMITSEMRSGTLKLVIKKALVDLSAPPFMALHERRHQWAVGDHYRFPGPIQFFGDRALTDSSLISLALEKEDDSLLVV